MALETLNGRSVSWAELTAAINVQGGQTLAVIDMKSIDYEMKVDRGEQRGVGGRVRKKTTGQGSNTAAAAFYKDGLDDLETELVKYAPQNDEGNYQLSKVTFDVIVKHSFNDDPKIYEVRLIGCHLDKISEKNAEGTDPVVPDIDLNPLRIVKIVDGKPVVLL
jgi:hypothetical protein